MDPGKYDQRVGVDRPVRTGDDAGGATIDWIEAAEVWAAVWPISAREQFSAAQVEGVATYRVRMRRRTDIKTDWRLRWVTNGGQVLRIKGPAIDNGPRVDWIEFLVESGGLGN